MTHRAQDNELVGSFSCHLVYGFELGASFLSSSDTAHVKGVSYPFHPGELFNMEVSYSYLPGKYSEMGGSFPFHPGEDIAIGVTSCNNQAGA